jgi:hypothetical protein
LKAGMKAETTESFALTWADTKDADKSNKKNKTNFLTMKSKYWGKDNNVERQ